MIRWYNTLISVVLALAIGFGVCLVVIPREIVVQPVMHFSPTIQVGPETLWEVPEKAPDPTVPRHPYMEKPVEDEVRAPRNLVEWVAAQWARWILR